MYTLTAADFADTGQWRLLLNIGFNGLEAFLENTLHSGIEPQELCHVEWNVDRREVCKQLEEAVYNNPRLLDDFATRIVIFDSHAMFIPKDIAEESAGSEQELYRKLYDVEARDVMTDSYADVTSVWSLAPDVKNFLMRTFPGARITCSLMAAFRRAHEEKNLLDDENEPVLFEEVRLSDVDMLLFKGKQLLSASTHSYSKEKDIRELEKKIARAYGFDHEIMKIHKN